MAATYSFRANLLHTLAQFRRPDVPLRVAMRAGLLVTAPLAVGVATGHEAVGLGLGAGAFNVIFSDQPGPYRPRLRRIALTALAAGVASLAGFLLGAHLVSLVLAAALCGFVAGLLVVFGADAARVGMISMILLVVAASEPMPWRQALPASALITAGGLLLALVSIAAWPLQRYRPEREVLAGVYRGLAQLARSSGADEDAPPLSDAINQLQRMLLRRNQTRGRAVEALRVLVELAERMRLELLAIGQLHPAGAGRELDAACTEVFKALADALEHAAPPRAAEQAAKRLRRCIDASDTPSALRPRLLALHGQVAAAIRNANWAGSLGEQRAYSYESRLPRALRGVSPWATLRANTTLSSVAFRHALRCAASLALAQWLERMLGLPHGYWLPMTAAIVLRPDFGATISFGLLRIAGTVLGLVLTSLLLVLAPHAVWAHIVLLGALVFAFRYLATAHYGLAVAALTGAVVILLSFEGGSPDAALLDRLLNTCLGSVLALLAYLAWPTWERSRTPGTLAAMLRAYADYLRALTAHGSPRTRREARAAARLARSNAQASLDRLRAEPGVDAAMRFSGESLFANGNRLARTAMTLEAVLQECADHPLRGDVDAFVERTAERLQHLADDCAGWRRPERSGDLRARQQALAERLATCTTHAASADLATLSDRLADNLGTIGHVLQRNTAPRAGAPADVPAGGP